MDAWEPVKQMYLNQFQPDQAPAYHAQRQEDERLYQRGLLSANPRQAGARPPGDPWRDAGQVAVAAPLLLPGLMMLPALDGAMSLMLTSNFYAALNDARKRYGLFD